MPKKSRRNRVKGKAATPVGVAAKNNGGGFDEGLRLKFGDRDQELATWLYLWSSSKEALMESFIDGIVSLPGVDPRFDKDCIPFPLRSAIETIVAAVDLENSAALGSMVQPACLTSYEIRMLTPYGMEAVRKFYDDGFEICHPLPKRIKYTEDLLRGAESLVSNNRCDIAASVLAFGLRCPQIVEFRPILLHQWTRYLMDRADVPVGNTDPFQDENAKRIVKAVSNDDEIPKHVRAFAFTLRALIACDRDKPVDRSECPNPNAVNFFRKTLLLERDIQPGEISLPATCVVNGDTSERIEMNLQSYSRMASEYLSVAQGPPACSGTALFEKGPKNTQQFDPITNYLTTGGSCCDHCGKTASEVGLPCLLKCKKCRMAFYCSVECQAARWSGGGHREHCKKYGRFGIGDKLVLFNLKKRSDLNTSLVEVIGKTSPDRLNVRICFPSQHEGAIVAAKKTNLRHHRPMK